VFIAFVFTSKSLVKLQLHFTDGIFITSLCSSREFQTDLRMEIGKSSLLQTHLVSSKSVYFQQLKIEIGVEHV